MPTVMRTCHLPTLEISTELSISKATNSQGDEKKQTDPVRNPRSTLERLRAMALTSVTLGWSPVSACY